MNQLFRTIQTNQLILGIVYIILGLPIALKPNQSFNLFISTLSLILFIYGLKAIISSYQFKRKIGYYDSRMMIGVSLLIAAAIVFFLARALLSIFPIIVGIGILISGVSQLMLRLNQRSVQQNQWFGITISVLIIIGGLIILLNPFSSVLAILQFGGLILIVLGIQNIINYFQMRNRKVF